MRNISELMQITLETCKRANIRHEFIPLPEDLPLDIASHVKFHGIPMKQAMATLLFKSENGFIAVVKRADCRINSGRLKKLVGVKKLNFASPDDLKELKAEIGIVPLVGLNLPHYVDQKVLEADTIYGGSGDKNYGLKMLSKDLLIINDAILGDFTDLEEGATDNRKKRILTGDTPTGKLHIDHYVGTLENRVKLQNEYETFIILADLHAFTTLSAYPDKVRESTMDVAIDNLAVGLDPEKVHIFVESQIP